MDEEREAGEGEGENEKHSQEIVDQAEGSQLDQSVSSLVVNSTQEEAVSDTEDQEAREHLSDHDQGRSPEDVLIESDQADEECEGEDDDDEEEEEEEEEEPLFKYQRLEGHIDKLFQNDNASALTTSEKHIGIGTHNGVVYILNHRIELIKRFRPHSATIYDIKIEVAEQFVATASMDGKISIVQIANGNDVFILDLKRPMMAVAMEPLYHKHPNKRQFISGGLAGNLTLHEKGWLGNKETILHSDEGSIWSAEWKNNLVVWANDTGVRIIDVNTHQKVAYIPRGADEPRADLYRCHFSWSTPGKLLVGWADTIRVVSIKENPIATHITRGLISTSSGSSSNVVVSVDMVFQVDCIISGICAWEVSGSPDIAILAHTNEAEDSDAEATGNECSPSDDGTTDSIAPRSSKRKPAQRPELRIISSNGEEISSDALNINSFQRYQPNDYCLCYLLPPPGNGKKKKMDDESLYVMSPKDLILVELRNRSDHISWMIEHQNYEGAMKEVEEAGLAGAHGYSLSEIGQKYLSHLISQGQFQVAADASPPILANDVKAWEDWIFMLTEKGQLDVIIPHVPTEEPRLSKVVYEVILVHLLRKNPQEMLNMIRKWSPELYSIPAVLSAALDRLSRDSGSSEILMTCIAELYILNHQPGKAVSYLLRLRKPEVFDLIKEHNLFTDVQDQALIMIKFSDELNRQNLLQKKDKESETREHGLSTPTAIAQDDQSPHEYGAAISLLVQHTYSIPVARVIAQLADHRRYQFMYLDALFEVDPSLGTDFGDLHVDLFAEFDRQRLMKYLRASTFYDLEKAYQICQDLNFVPEMVYLLGRMGNNKKALFLIIDRIGDVHRAIEFAKEQNDDDLWEDLLRYSETRPAFIRGLLDNVGSEIDPIRLIRRIQNGLEIPDLKASIIKILQDFHLQISLIEGCRSIMVSDCRDLSNVYYTSQTLGALGDPTLRCQKCNRLLTEPSKPIAATDDGTEFIAEGSIAEIGSAISIMFLCRHSFHSLCVFDSNTVLAALAEQQLDRNRSGFDQSFDSDRQRFSAINLKFAQTLILRSGDGSCPICITTPTSKNNIQSLRK
ncbi:hypothetical protein Pst134EA_009234 [Puccinia striiformis f. sp. tritici]|uniref:Vacuolar protein sorting-associated protein 41 n=1 Tax=Puccinia striiformis f. sp. tritici PST-78 TaxID=1165861 RepID=A0A0L0URY4_9BASI|nr:hypothetical protein Pst134EA_009234 [Puccinia striiformis f. sp. tritici]KAH9468700.1 hypothetical protein Pst134EA_009234 [Puccinia striiformis f. sp. tritici]KNE89843.1 hypothetical protein PSTG_16703 [Puccinia striiformis f. sp. tritici PST-78]